MKYVAAIMKKTVAMSVFRPCRIATIKNGGDTLISNAKVAARRRCAPSSTINR